MTLSEDGAILLRTASLPFEVLEPFGAPRTAAALDALAAGADALRAAASAISEKLFEAAGPGGVPRDSRSHRQRNAILALRRAVYNRRPLDAGALEQAAPALSEDLQRTLRKLEADRLELLAVRAQALKAFEQERQDEAAALLRAVRCGPFRESIRLAGRSLYDALGKLESRDPGRWRSDESHVASKISAYLVRAVTKTSPNALFAATALAEPGPFLGASGTAGPERVNARLNVSEARKVAAVLAADHALRPAVRPRPNPTLRHGDDGWTWWRLASLRHRDDDEVRMEAGHNPVLETVLSACANGERTWPGVVEAVGHGTGFGSAEVEPFLERLVDNGFLVAEIEIPANEPRPLAYLAAAARSTGGVEASLPWIPQLESLEHAMDALPPLGSGERIAALKTVERRLSALPHARPLDPDDLFRVDAASGLRATLPPALREEVARAVDAYVRLFAALYPPPPRSPFATRFLEVFPPDVDVPLLDLYHGVFEPEERRQPGAFPSPSALGLGGGEPAFRRLLDHLEARAAEGAREVILTAADLAELGATTDPPRWMCGALFQVAAAGPGRGGGPETRIVLNALFHGAGLALSRFHDLLEKHEPPVAGEERPVLDSGRIADTLRRGWLSLVPRGALPAEITYTHWGRTANAGLRPRIFPREIELPGDTASPQSEVIPLGDLTVRYDRDRERFGLHSRSRKAEMVPFLSSGVQPEGFAAFLVHIGLQNLMPVAYFPGFDRPDGPVHWPRFTLGRVVLFRERWVFGPEDGPAGGTQAALSEPGAGWFEAVHRWRRHHALPRRVFVSSEREAKPFYVDLESPVGTDLLRRYLAGGGAGPPDRFTVTEMLPGPGDLWLRDPAGRYASEFLIQLAGPLPQDPQTGGTP